jgi:hypothetical protein
VSHVTHVTCDMRDACSLGTSESTCPCITISQSVEHGASQCSCSQCHCTPLPWYSLLCSLLAVECRGAVVGIDQHHLRRKWNNVRGLPMAEHPSVVAGGTRSRCVACCHKIPAVRLTLTLSCSPCCATYSSAAACTASKSKVVHVMCWCALATAQHSTPAEPPMSPRVRYLLKSNCEANSSKAAATTEQGNRGRKESREGGLAQVTACRLLLHLSFQCHIGT